jgi:hypothetical protein
MPQGKPAGVRCVQLDSDFRCALFGRPERPAVCASLMPTREMCGLNKEHALQWLAALEEATRPAEERPGALNPRSAGAPAA